MTTPAAEPAPTEYGPFLKAQMGWLRPHRNRLIGAVSLQVVVIAQALGVPILFQLIYDDAVANRDFVTLGMYLGILLGLLVLGSAADIIFGHVNGRLVARVMATLRIKAFDHVQRMSSDFYARHESGDLMSRFSIDLVALEDWLTSAITSILTSGLMVLGSTVLLFVFEWHLALASLFLLPIAYFGARRFSPRATDAANEKKRREGRVGVLFQESIAAHVAIRMFRLQPRRKKTFESEIDGLSKGLEKQIFFSNLVKRMALNSLDLMMCLVVGLGAALVIMDKMSVGTFMGFVALLLNLAGGVRRLTEVVPVLIDANASYYRVEEIFAYETRIIEQPDALTVEGLNDGIEITDLRFAYDGEHDVLQIPHLHIPSGASVALIGPSGSGKTTLLRQITRDYEPQVGEIRFDGQDIRHLSLDTFYGQMGIVFQQPSLLRASVRENIRVGRLDATDADVEEAARAAEIHDSIMRLPQGYDTVVGASSSRLSSGQRQRLAIARALIRNPSILILDEATGALDASTEAAVNETIKRLSANRTVISVTHRLGPVPEMDLIIVLDKGQIIEQGNHRDLLAADGYYAKLWAKQRGLNVTAKRATVSPDRLRQLDLFAVLGDATLSQLAALFTSELAAEGEIIFEAGTEGTKLYLLAHGTADVYGDSIIDGEPPIARLDKGDVFGEIALMREVPRTATVQARTPCTLLVLHRDHFALLIASDPKVRTAMETLATNRLRQDLVREDASQDDDPT